MKKTNEKEKVKNVEVTKNKSTEKPANIVTQISETGLDTESDFSDFDCEVRKCDFVAETKQSMITHIQLKHFINHHLQKKLKGYKFECKECGNFLHSIDKLPDHIMVAGACARQKIDTT